VREVTAAGDVLRRAGRRDIRSLDSETIVTAIDVLFRTSDPDAVHELLFDGFLRDSAERYDEYVASGMRGIGGACFEMGTPRSEARHFCGESPRHAVELSPYAIGTTPVTNELYGLFDAGRLHAVRAGDRGKPVVGVTWFDAALFSLWMGCRLPTEAEWEFACGAGSAHQWCCEDERELTRFAWFGENSAGQVREAATREPNAHGLFDLHGNVWEWCVDAYDETWYARSPVRDPLNREPSPGSVAAAERHRVCRGGSVYALAEMCRTRYRLHDPPGYWASDLGFRLARGCDGEEEMPQ
jgi:formylglycine-generating enzyme